MEEKEAKALLKVRGTCQDRFQNFHKIMSNVTTVVWEQGQTNCSKEQNKEPRQTYTSWKLTFANPGWKSQM